MTMQIAPFFVLITIAVIVILPTMAHRGKGYRGAWAAMMVVGLLVAGFSLRVLAANMDLFHSTLTDAELAEIGRGSRSEIDQTILWSLVTLLCSAGLAIESILAGCFSRTKAHQAESGRLG